MKDIELLELYKNKVSEIPEIRQCLAYPEENAVKILSYFIDKEIDKELPTVTLVGLCMRELKGHANPSFVLQLINEWKETE